MVTTGEGADELFGGYDLFRENAVRHFWARARVGAAPAAPHAAERLHRQGPEALGAFLVGFYRKGLTETGDPLYSHAFASPTRRGSSRSSTATCSPGLLSAATPPSAWRRACPVVREMTPLGKVQYLEIATFLEGYLLRTQGDRMLMGTRSRAASPSSTTASPSSRRASGPASAAGPVGEVPAAEGCRAPAAGRDRVPQEAPYRAPIVGAFVGPDAPPTCASSWTSAASPSRGCSPRRRSRASCKCEAGAPRDAVSETDEMALVGVLSVLLLHDRFVARPRLAEPLVPDRVVIGDQCKRRRPAAGDRMNVRLLHETLLASAERCPSARRSWPAPSA